MRRRRRRRRGRRGGRGVDTADHAGPRRTPPNWQWRTFPVLFAFVAGIVLMGLVAAGEVLGPVVFFAGVFGVAFGVAHIVARLFIASRRR